MILDERKHPLWIEWCKASVGLHDYDDKAVEKFEIYLLLFLRSLINEFARAKV